MNAAKGTFAHRSTSDASVLTRLEDATPLGFLARVQIEKRQDNQQQNDLPKDEYTAIKAAGFVVGVHVNDERPKSNARSQPDNLSFGVPHGNSYFDLRTLIRDST